jgi:hypothetical protein
MLNRKNITRLISVSSLLLGYVFANSNTAFANPVRGKFDSIQIAQTSQQGEPTQENILEDNDFKFQLNGCQHKAKKITCTFLIINLLNQDRTVWIASGDNYGSRIIDTSGNEYFANFVQIGKQKDSAGHATFTQNIPLKASIVFEIPQGLSKLASLEFRYQVDANPGKLKVEYRNVEVAR